jgi:diguanylate cyclase (GGDEF)-like protein/PAS domain S-box-containing protein
MSESDYADIEALTAKQGFAVPGNGELGTLDREQLERQLRDIKARYRGLIDRLPAVVYIDGLEEDASMVDVGPGIEALYGLTRDVWIGSLLAWLEPIHPDDVDRIVAANERSIATGEPFRERYRIVHPDRGEVWINEEAVLIHDENGEPRYWLGLMLDVTEIVETERRVDDAQARYAALVEQIPAIVYVDEVDESMSSSYVSPQIEQILGITPEQYIAEPDIWERHLHPDDHDDALRAYLFGRASGQPFQLEYRLIADDGRVVWFHDSATVLPGPDGNPAYVHGVMLDVTERKEAEARIAFLAYHDKLTGLPNRAMFDELLELALARAVRHDLGVAVISLDVDNFKLINDSLGHEAGDALIVQLARRLKEATRETDLVARQGGDEFLLLLSDLEAGPPVAGTQDDGEIVARSVAMRIQEILAAPFEIGSTELYLTASLGISMFPRNADDGPSLLKNADTAMFRSKNGGPGAYAMYGAEDGTALRKLSLSTRLRKAVESRAWALHYQPLIELETGRTYGVEALIRWPDPAGGLVPPGEFIPLAEELGLIEAIGDWVLDELCRQDAAWRAEGLELELAFNLSPRQFWQSDLVDRIVDRLKSGGVAPRRVCVEITESTAMTDPDRTTELLEGLHGHGLRIAIDDFGTGYSSLSRLKLLPVEVLKIDRSFISHVDADPQSASMVSAMIALASNLGMTPLAEGIEAEAERSFLVDHGCELGQGFFFSKPVPADEILAMHRRAQLEVVHGTA